MVDIPRTYGALLLGGFLAVALSGIVTVQCYMYFKMYPADRKRLKLLVLSVWILDTCHTGFVCASAWDYLVGHFGETAYIDYISWSVALTIVFTAILTFCVHCFFAQRIYKLSNRNYYITIPVPTLAFLRLLAATVTTVEMMRLRSFYAFVAQFRWVFTLGLALSSAIDILIAVFLCYFLRAGRTGTSNLDHVLDTLILYTFENGSLTCAATIISMICWLAMPHNLIFMGLHFAISKIYSNSLLATLNARRQLQQAHSGSSNDNGGIPVLLPGSLRLKDRYSYRANTHTAASKGHVTTRLEINVEKTIQCEVDEDQA